MTRTDFRESFPVRNGLKGFTLIEVMVVLVIISVLMGYAINEYSGSVNEARVTRARADLEEFAKSIRLYNIKESRPFEIGTFSVEHLGTFIGNYLEKAPPLDPWERHYRHRPELGVVYSIGLDGIDGYVDSIPGGADDVVARYLPREFFITRVEYVDTNRNNRIDFGDYTEIHLSRKGRFADVNVLDFVTENPPDAFGTAQVEPSEDGRSIRIVFAPPIPSSIIPGETILKARVPEEGNLGAITDYSNPPENLINLEDLVINRRPPQ